MTNELTTETKGIHQLIEKFTNVWNLHDAQAFSLVFAKDADFTNLFGKRIHGQADIGAFHDTVFKTMFKESHLNVTDISIRFFDSAMAAVDVMWLMTGATDSQGNEWPNRKGLMSLIMKHENGTWQILIMHNMDLPEASMPLQFMR